MSKRFIATLTLLASMGFMAPSVVAFDGQHHDDDQRDWQAREGYEYRVYDQKPEGWKHGKKVGWDQCGLPPGQAKKYGCYTYSYQGRPYYYYQGEGGRIYVRRPADEHHDEHHDHDHDR